MSELSDPPSNMIVKTMYRRELFCGDTSFTSQNSFAVRSALLEASGRKRPATPEARGEYIAVAYKVQPVAEPLPKTELATSHSPNREAWLRGEIILASGFAEHPDSEVGRAVKNNLRDVEDGARMFTKPVAIKSLRSTKAMNHEPPRKIEQEWLDRIFSRERMSKAWIGLASVLADAGEQGSTSKTIYKLRVSDWIRWNGNGEGVILAAVTRPQQAEENQLAAFSRLYKPTE
jgi:hypothetical protein